MAASQIDAVKLTGLRPCHSGATARSPASLARVCREPVSPGAKPDCSGVVIKTQSARHSGSSALSSATTLSTFKVIRTANKQETTASNRNFSSNPLEDRQRIPHDGSDRPGAGGARKVAILWFRNDLRVHDNEALHAANRDSTSLLPVFCFDPRQYTKLPGGGEKTGSYRARFIQESVADLRQRLQDLGSQLIVRFGKPEEVIAELARKVGASAVYCHSEVTYEEMEVEKRVATALKAENAKLRTFWGNTLFHIDDLPFQLPDIPSNYSGFQDQMAAVNVRAALESPQRLKGMPVGASIEHGDIPSLQQLGMKLRTDPHAAAGSLSGGETEALRRLQQFIEEARSSNSSASATLSGYGAQFSCKISPWLGTGTLSPRRMYEAARHHLPAGTSASAGSSGNSIAWLRSELLWRDFFRFITKKYAAVTPKHEPATHHAMAAGQAISTAACEQAVLHPQLAMA